jgi:hypothetical protein
MMDKEDIEKMRKVAREVFWDLWDTDLLPLLKDFIGIRLDASRVKEEAKPTIQEDMFGVLGWESSKGAKLGDYETAFKSLNKVADWEKCFNILRDNKATIGESFHLQGYVYRYWVFPEKYQDRIFRKRLGESEAKE